MNQKQRIVSLLPSATEIVCALGLESSLVGITHECDFPRSVTCKPVLTASRISHETMSSAEIDHAVRSHLDGHGSIYDLDEELLKELKPDLIVTQELCEVCAVSYKTVLGATRLLDGDTTVISLEPNTLDDIFQTILTVGEITRTKDFAQQLVASLRQRIDIVKKKTISLPRPRTLMMEWLEPVFAPGHWVPEQVNAAGGDSGFGTPGAKSTTTTDMAIRDYDPEVIVLIPCGYYKEDILRQLPLTNLPACWPDLSGIKSGNVWAVDATSFFSRPGPRVVDGIEILSKILHPDVFGVPSIGEAIQVSG